MKYISFLTVFLSVISCKSPRENEVISLDVLASTRLGEKLPEPENNKSSLQGIALGKKLFFDPALSGSGKVSCSSCHFPEKSFTDGVALTNIGESHNQLERNSPALVNLAWQKSFFWDGGTPNLESQAIAPLLSKDEMASDLITVEKYLNSSSEYKQIFKQVFGVDTIKTAHLLRAISQFERSLISCSSKFDLMKEGKSTFSESEMSGMLLFQKHCATCHAPPLFTDHLFHNNGLDSEFNFDNPEDQRWGRFRITENLQDIGRYKTPTLRNLFYTAPYMHDGRISSLEDVLIHYISGVKKSATLAEEIPNEGFSFTEKEKNQLISFLLTLNDPEFVNRSQQ